MKLYHIVLGLLLIACSDDSIKTPVEKPCERAHTYSLSRVNEPALNGKNVEGFMVALTPLDSLDHGSPETGIKMNFANEGSVPLDFRFGGDIDKWNTVLPGNSFTLTLIVTKVACPILVQQVRWPFDVRNPRCDTSPKLVRYAVRLIGADGYSKVATEPPLIIEHDFPDGGCELVL